MGRLIGVLDQIRSEFGSAVLAIAHTGHENTDRERGSSALRGAADVSIRARRTQPYEVKLECAKMRDAEEFEPRVVRLLPVAGSLVAAEAVTRTDAMERDVRAYLQEHRGASMRQVVSALKGRNVDIQAAYRKCVRRVRTRDTPRS
jgi:hypothetical protein